MELNAAWGWVVSIVDGDAKNYGVTVAVVAAVVVAARTFAKIVVTASFRAEANLIILHLLQVAFPPKKKKKK